MTENAASEKQPRIRAKLTNDWVDYPHNDLSSAAWSLRNRINQAFAGDDRVDGIFLDMMACATMIAFSLEGYLNFLGAKLIDEKTDEWACFERASAPNKIKAIRRLTGIKIDWNKRPYLTTKKLINLRNQLAHPKPKKAEPREWIAEGTDSDFKKKLRNYEPDWVKTISQDFINEAYDDVEAIWKALLKAANIDEHQAFSGGSQGIELIEVLYCDKK